MKWTLLGCWRGSSASRTLPPRLRHLVERHAEFFEFGNFADQPAQGLHRSGDMIEERFVAFDEPEESVGSQRLHEPLDSAATKDRARIGRDGLAGRGALGFVIGEELVAFGARESDVRIKKQGGEIVLSQAGPHSLEIDQMRLAVANNDVLRLKIAMDQNPRSSRQFLRDLA